VLEHGQIVENGAHEDLIQKDGLYANLHRIQFSNT
jgi:subfamily B ATP-binding cassette protein MsbA